MKTLLRFLPVLLLALPAGAHPMGNFSVNHYAKIQPGAEAIDIEYVLDLAEIPTLQLQQTWGVPAAAPPAQLQPLARAQAKTWASNLDLRLAGRRVAPEVLRTNLVVVPGAGGLPVYRITTALRVPATGGKFTYADGNFSERAGWREIVIAPAHGATVQHASQGTRDLSQALTAYPQDPTLAPPQDVRASLEWSGTPSPVAAPQPAVLPTVAPMAPLAQASPQPVASTPMQPNSLGNLSRSGFLSRTLANRGVPIGFSLGLTCMLVAFGLGALHAIEPGHGKTMVAAYLVGSRGTPKHAVMLGAMVTFTHTVSVFLLGFITLFLARYIMPETLTKYLGILSGLSIVWIGALLVYRRWRTYAGTAHTHGHSEGHHHHHEPAPAAHLTHSHSHDSHSHDREHAHTHDHDQAHAHGHAHTHDHDHGHSHAHDHAHDHGHSHTHDHAHSHSHDHGHSHTHAHTHDHSHALTHTHDGHTHTHEVPADLTIGSLLALGASGGMVPCPAALVLLLSCISLGRPALGITLLLAFSLGLALVLMAIGLAVVGAKSLLPASSLPSASSPWMRMLPVASALVIFAVGVVMTGAALGVLPAIRFLG